MADIRALVSVGSVLRKAIASDRVVYPGDVLIEGDVIIRGGEEVDSLETLMPVVIAPGVAGSGGEALRLDTSTPATGANPIMHGGYVQFGSRCWTGAASVFGAGMRIAGIIDTQLAGVPATYHLSVQNAIGGDLVIVRQNGALSVPNSSITAGSYLSSYADKIYTDYGARFGVANQYAWLTTTNTFNIESNISATAGTEVAVRLGTGVAYATAGQKLLSVMNASSEKAYIDYLGAYVVPKTALTALADPATVNPTANDGILLTNNASGATATQQFSPSLRLDAVGYTAAATYTRQSWAITNKPTSATAGVLAFDFATGGGAYAATSPMSISNTGLLALDSIRTTSHAYIRGTSGFDVVVIGNQSGPSGYGIYGNASSTPLLVQGTGTSGTPPASVWIGNMAGTTAENVRLVLFNNGTAIKSGIDKDGAYWNAYGSGQIAGAASKVATLVTTCDTDSTYIVEYYAAIMDQAGGVAHTAGWFGQALYDKAGAGTLVRRGGTVVEIYDAGGDYTCADSVSGESIVVTATSTNAGITVNVKVWGVRVMKVGKTALGAGVAYPLAT